MPTRQHLREDRQLHSRRTRALLAAGLVFGAGASSTLAAWNDSEHGAATFIAGTFGVVGSTDGVTYAEHETEANAASLGFALVAGGPQLVPGSEAFALFSVKTRDPSVAGTVQLEAESSNLDGLGAYLSYSVRVIAGTTCNTAAFNAGTAAGLPQNAGLATGATAAQALAADGASPVHYCFKVVLPGDTPNASQGKSVTARWKFVATNA